jgi:RecJ-like exonuclease
MTPLLWFDIADLQNWEGYDEPNPHTDSLMEAEVNEQFGKCPECEGVGTVEGDKTCPTCNGKKVLCYNLVHRDEEGNIIDSSSRWIQREARRSELADMIEKANEDVSYI